MAKPAGLDPERAYVFSDYFRLNFDLEDILAYFGYGFERRSLQLPQTSQPLDRLPSLRQRLEESLPLISLDNEAARREFLIAPVLVDILHYTGAKLKLGYGIEVDFQLKGVLDYFLKSQATVAIVEAKDENLQRGFTQLAVELIALDRWLDPSPHTPLLYGAVSIGTIWQFGSLDRRRQHITQGLTLYRVPEEVEPIQRILVGILQPDERHSPTIPTPVG